MFKQRLNNQHNHEDAGSVAFYSATPNSRRVPPPSNEEYHSSRSIPQQQNQYPPIMYLERESLIDPLRQPAQEPTLKHRRDVFIEPTVSRLVVEKNTMDRPDADYNSNLNSHKNPSSTDNSHTFTNNAHLNFFTHQPLSTSEPEMIKTVNLPKSVKSNIIRVNSPVQQVEHAFFETSKPSEVAIQQYTLPINSHYAPNSKQIDSRLASADTDATVEKKPTTNANNSNSSDPYTNNFNVNPNVNRTPKPPPLLPPLVIPPTPVCSSSSPNRHLLTPTTRSTSIQQPLQQSSPSCFQTSYYPQKTLPRSSSQDLLTPPCTSSSSAFSARNMNSSSPLMNTALSPFSNHSCYSPLSASTSASSASSSPLTPSPHSQLHSNPSAAAANALFSSSPLKTVNPYNNYPTTPSTSFSTPTANASPTIRKAQDDLTQQQQQRQQQNLHTDDSISIASTVDQNLAAAEKLVHEGIQYHEAGKLEQATTLFKQASMMNLPIAMFLYGISLRHGWGCKKNEHLAFQYLQKAAELAVEDLEHFSTAVQASAAKSELIMAIYELGVSFRHGWGCKKNKATAVYYFKIAADLNDPDAQNDLGYCFYNGHGVKKDLYMAAKYFRKADKQGHGIMGNSWIWKSKYDKPPVHK